MREYVKGSDALREHIEKLGSLLDIGCGSGRWIGDMVFTSYLGVDICKEYLEELKSKRNVIRLDIRDLSMFLDDSYDIVMAVDVVEHLEKDWALRVISEMERIARIKCIIVTPDRFVPQDETVRDDQIGMLWNEWQRHRCGFSEEELLKLGYSFILKDPQERYFKCRDKLGYRALFAVKYINRGS